MALIISNIIIILYAIALFCIFLYSLIQLHLLINLSKNKKINTQVEETFNIHNEVELPYVTIQLPVYNEKYVMERLLHCVSEIDYPLHKLHIQVLDDSTDDSIPNTLQLINAIKQKGIDIEHIHRTDRKNFKAGALKDGLTTAKGEYIAIFDADFLPQKDWLLKTIIYFKNKNIGVVQTRWGHINENQSLLTKVQAFALNSHFILEQTGRNSNNFFINFNGTAGIWRKSTIIDAGNWQGDTLTEDLDLSYRAQLKGWKFKYLQNVVTPAELPIAISAARSQQFRWNKGGAENFIKMLSRITKNKTINRVTKLHCYMHLANSTMFLFVLLLSILSVPMLFIKNTYAHLDWAFNANGFFLLSTVILFICNWYTYKKVNETNPSFFKYFKLFFTFFTVALGFTFHNTIAVIEAFAGKKSAFIRTPKFNISDLNKNWKSNIYLTKKIPLSIIVEIFLLLYFIFGLVSAIVLKDISMLPFLLMLCIGYFYVVFKSLQLQWT
jgi:cellulose synthase/poly-beta-1,6-N-acetylglucosamine synthase-like glycosyltransferase